MTPALLTRIQPCLLDRLTDRDPTRPREAEGTASLSLEDYRRSVERDLRWLLSTGAPPEVQPKDGFKPPSDYYMNPSAYARRMETASGSARTRWVDIRQFREAARSTISYGLRQVAARPGPWGEGITLELQRMLRAFEPRILAETISLSAMPERQYLHITITGQLLSFPTSEDFQLRARIDRESGEIVTA